jgi:condensin complex subunit 2
LIDYFADMSLLRDGDSINFQKASYTLDGCVKVYTSRIDSVDLETKQLLLGLATTKEAEETLEEGTKKTRRDVSFI